MTENTLITLVTPAKSLGKSANAMITRICTCPARFGAYTCAVNYVLDDRGNLYGVVQGMRAVYVLTRSGLMSAGRLPVRLQPLYGWHLSAWDMLWR